MTASLPTVVLFTSLPEVGGHTTITIGLSKMLRRQGYEVEVLCKNVPGHGLSESAVKEITELGCRFTMLSDITGKLDKKAALRVCGRYLLRPATVFLAISMRNLSPIFAMGIRNKLSLYYHLIHDLKPESIRRLKVFSWIFDKLLFIAPATYQDFKVSCRDLRRIDWCMQESSLGFELNGHQRSPRPTVRFGLLGRITKGKGAEEILKFIDESDIPCEVHIAGAGEHAKDFKDRAERPSDRSKVRVVYYGSYSAGERTQFLRRFFAEVDWLCIPSLDEWEGIPTVALEALQHGVSVLTTRAGGLKSFEMAELGPPSSDVVWRVDPQDFRATMRRIAVGDIPAPPDPERCVRYYEKYFSSDTIAAKWAKVMRP